MRTRPELVPDNRWSASEWRQNDRKDRTATATGVQQLALMLAHDCLLYEGLVARRDTPRYEEPVRRQSLKPRRTPSESAASAKLEKSMLAWDRLFSTAHN